MKCCHVWSVMGKGSNVKAPISRGEQGQEHFTHVTDCTKKNQATEIQDCDMCKTDQAQAEMGHIIFHIDTTHNVQFSASILLFLRNITNGFYEMRGFFSVRRVREWNGRKYDYYVQQGELLHTHLRGPGSQWKIFITLSLKKTKVVLMLRKGAKSIS